MFFLFVYFVIYFNLIIVCSSFVVLFFIIVLFLFYLDIDCDWINVLRWFKLGYIIIVD